MSTIYMLRCLVNGKVYIGQTISPILNRWRRHRNSANRGDKTHLNHAILKYGPGNFEVIPLIRAADRSTADYLEAQTIRDLKATDPDHGYNIRPGGNSSPIAESTKRKMSLFNKGKILSAEHRAKISLSHKGLRQSAEHRRKNSITHKGLPAWNKGKPFSIESREKMSLSHRIRLRDPAERIKLAEYAMGNSNATGHVVSDEARAKMSEAKKGKRRAPLSLETRAKIARALIGNKNGIGNKGYLVNNPRNTDGRFCQRWEVT